MLHSSVEQWEYNWDCSSDPGKAHRNNPFQTYSKTKFMDKTVTVILEEGVPVKALTSLQILFSGTIATTPSSHWVCSLWRGCYTSLRVHHTKRVSSADKLLLQSKRRWSFCLSLSGRVTVITIVVDWHRLQLQYYANPSLTPVVIVSIELVDGQIRWRY